MSTIALDKRHISSISGILQEIDIHWQNDICQGLVSCGGGAYIHFHFEYQGNGYDIRYVPSSNPHRPQDAYLVIGGFVYIDGGIWPVEDTWIQVKQCKGGLEKLAKTFLQRYRNM